MMKMINDRVLVKRAKPAEKTKGGIFIPDSAQERIEAVVIAAGPGLRNSDGERNPLAVSEGMKVMLSKWSGVEVKIDGEEHLVVREDDILGVVL